MADAWTTVVVREPEWDDLTRNQHLAKRAYDREVDPGCGLHKSILENPADHQFVFETPTCAICREIERQQRMIADRDNKWLEQFKGKTPPADEYRPADGVHLKMRPATAKEIEDAQELKARELRTRGGHG